MFFSGVFVLYRKQEKRFSGRNGEREFIFVCMRKERKDCEDVKGRSDKNSFGVCNFGDYFPGGKTD